MQLPSSELSLVLWVISAVTYYGGLLGSRAINLPQFCYGGRERRGQDLHPKHLTVVA